MLEKTGRIDIGRIDKLIPTFAGDKGILLAFLFGSHAHGEGSAMSDVDLALLLAPSVLPDNYLDYRSRYFSLAAHTLQDDRIDVVILNTAPPLLAHEALKGRVLFERSPEARVAYMVNVQRKYLDLKYLYALDYSYMRKRLKEGTFGQP